MGTEKRKREIEREGKPTVQPVISHTYSPPIFFFFQFDERIQNRKKKGFRDFMTLTAWRERRLSDDFPRPLPNLHTHEEQKSKNRSKIDKDQRAAGDAQPIFFRLERSIVFTSVKRETPGERKEEKKKEADAHYLTFLPFFPPSPRSHKSS